MNRQTLTVLVVVVVVIAGGWMLQQESFYAKQTIGERIWRTISYAIDNQLALVSSAVVRDKVFVLDVPLYKQERSLTCEVAALRMALGSYQVDVSEDDLLDRLYFDTRQPMVSGVWGDPDKGFIGDPNGSFSDRTGYGVYEHPIRDLARKYRSAEVLQTSNIQSVANLVSAGKPVLVWMVFSGRDFVYWDTHDGGVAEGHPGEHVRVVVGFIGEASNPKKFILHDPIYGKVTLSATTFAREWGVLGNRAVVLN